VEARQKIKRIAIAGALILGGILSWFFGNFFYDIFWAFLEAKNIQHVNAIAYALGHLTPFILAFVVITIIYLLIRYEFDRVNREREVPSEPLQQGTPIADAIDYIVNDSTAKLKQPGPAQIMGFGPAKGRRAVEVGVEHSDARTRLNEKLISGELRCWGRRQIDTHIANQFEHTLREIPKEYWDSMQLDFLSCFHNTDRIAQTATIPGKTGSVNFTQLTLNKNQVFSLWPKKPVWSRAYRKLRRKSRISYWRIGEWSHRSRRPVVRGGDRA
jgi:membrane-associated protease RseP (regulator of RpoE activity)